MSSPKLTNPPKSSQPMAAKRGLLQDALGLLIGFARIVVGTASLSALIGCSTPSPVATVAPFCEVIHDTCISRSDTLTEGTARKIEGDNLSLRRMCVRRNECKSEPKVATAEKG